jgi:NitT/TauT family transport system substrate-binding protein
MNSTLRGQRCRVHALPWQHSGMVTRLRNRAGAVIMFLVAAIASSVSAAAPLTLAVTDSPHALPVLIAEKLGYFAEEGLPLKIVHVQVGRIGLERLLAGEVQFATVADTPIMFASLRLKDFRIVATTTRSTGENTMITRTERGIRTAADLKGKRIGVPRGSGGHYFVDTYLLYNGLTTADVRIVVMEASEVVDALVRGDVDVAGLFGVFASTALQRLGANARILTVPDFFSVSFSIVTVPASAGVSDADVGRLLRAVQRAIELIRSNPGKARALSADILKVDAAEIARTWNDFEYRLHLDQPMVAQLEAQVRWALREKLVPADTRMPDFLDLIRSEPLRKLDPRAVRLVQ